MAHLKDRRPQNIDGDIYVDTSCIDCDTCRWMVPTVFTREDGQSAVHHQPATEAERLAALQAVLACPTASIGTVEPPQRYQSRPGQLSPAHCGERVSLRLPFRKNPLGPRVTSFSDRRATS